MKKRILIVGSIAALIFGGLIFYSEFYISNEKVVVKKVVENTQDATILNHHSLVPVVPNIISGFTKIAMIDTTPETEINTLLDNGDVPDEITIVSIMRFMADWKLGLSQFDTPLIELTPERVELISDVIQMTEVKQKYKNSELLAQIAEQWRIGDFSTIEGDDKKLKEIEYLHSEALIAIENQQKEKIAPAKELYIQEIIKAVGEKKKLSMNRFEDALEEWLAAPYNNKQPYELSPSERKQIAESVYSENTLQTTGDILAEFEKMFSGERTYTYDRYVALTHYLTSGQAKEDSYQFNEFYPLPYFPLDYNDKEITATSISDSYLIFHQYIDKLKE